ncbi:MAG: ribosomal protein S18-alanine N-acetyltransferase [Candidatus Coproplasma sp.]
MIVREWRFEDILPVSRLEEECFKTDRWSYRTFASCFENPAFYGVVAEEDGEIIGFGGITVVADNCDLENIFISEPYRRCCTGAEILKTLLAAAKNRGAEKMFLEVRVSNCAAMAMYLKLGFCGSYARARYYSDGEDCLVMRRDL